MATILGVAAAATVFLFGDLAAFKVTPAVLWMMALLIWIAASSAWSVNPRALDSVLLWIAMGMMFIAVLQVVQTANQLRVIAIGYLVGAFSASIRLLIEQARLDIQGAVRLTTIFGDVNINYVAYALAAGWALLVLLWDSRRKGSAVATILMAVAAVGVLIGIQTSQTRGALLGTVFAAAWIVLRRLFGLRSLAIPTLAVVTAAALALSGIGDQSSLQFEAGGRATGDWSGRIPLWDAARTIWALRPLVGFGVGSFGHVSGYGIAAHNVLLDIGVGLGVVGVLLFIAVLVSCLWLGTRSAPQVLRSEVIGVFLAASSPAYLTGVWATAPAAWICLALVARIGVVHPPDSAAVR
ncbi:MAG: hypothetical protein IPL41_17805 [Micropruina sp.]|nr:hypothetical protein [Micropruina sp.]